MEYIHCCVIDSASQYKTLVLVLNEKNETGEVEARVQSYVMLPGEKLIETTPPNMRLHTGVAGFIRPGWEENAGAWAERATGEEIAAWEAEHPAPQAPGPEEDVLTLTQLAVAELAAVVEEHNTANQLAIAELAEAVLGGE